MISAKATNGLMTVSAADAAVLAENIRVGIK